MKYIRQWGKKVVFVVNKVDMLSNDSEVKEVVNFVGDSATRLLGVERSQVTFPSQLLPYRLPSPLTACSDSSIQFKMHLQTNKSGKCKKLDNQTLLNCNHLVSSCTSLIAIYLESSILH